MVNNLRYAFYLFSAMIQSIIVNVYFLLIYLPFWIFGHFLSFIEVFQTGCWFSWCCSSYIYRYCNIIDVLFLSTYVMIKAHDLGGNFAGSPRHSSLVKSLEHSINSSERPSGSKVIPMSSQGHLIVIPRSSRSTKVSQGQARPAKASQGQPSLLRSTKVD